MRQAYLLQLVFNCIADYLVMEEEIRRMDEKTTKIIEIYSCRGDCPYECQQTGTCSLTMKNLEDPASIPEWCTLPDKFV